MPTLKFTARARNDLGAIVKYIAIDNSKASQRIAFKILKKCEFIAAQPTMAGRLREEFASGLRSGLCKPYIIFYHTVDDAVEILQIIHGSRDIKRALKE